MIEIGDIVVDGSLSTSSKSKVIDVNYEEGYAVLLLLMQDGIPIDQEEDNIGNFVLLNDIDDS